jgi:hypothetical protein
MANRSSTDTNIDRRGKDMMGYPLKRQLKDYTDLDIEAARVLAKEAGYEWDCVYTDPAVTGKRFLKSAKIVRQFLEDQAMLCAAQDAHGRVPVVTTGLEYDPNSASGYRAPPAVAQASVDAIRQTIADEWGSHLCYRHPDGLRHCDGDKRCRCVDIARAIVSEHGAAQDVPGSREATLKRVANLFAKSVHETYTREEVVSLIEDMIRLDSPVPSTHQPKTYSELLPVGTRVKVHAAMRREGSDHDWHGRTGTIVNWLGGNSWAEVQMDKPKRDRPNPVPITAHNLMKASDAARR